jgi:predicted small secreted protein
LRDVALKCPAESFCNTSRGCGACCPRCSEALPAWTCNKCNTLRGDGGKLIKDLPARAATMS